MGGEESNYPVTLSDWINYLMCVINNYEKKFGDNTTTVFIIGATVLSIFSLSLSTISLALVFAEHGFKFNIASTNNTLLGLAIVLAFISVILVSVAFYQKISKKSRYAKACNLLLKIMKGDIIDPRKVRDAWFREEEKKMNFWKTLSYGILGLSFIFAIIGFFGFDIARNSAITMLPIGIAIYALAQSEEMDKRLTLLGTDSNNKLKTIGNATFMEIVDIFEDKRIKLWGFIRKNKFKNLEETTEIIEITCWKCKTYSFRALKLIETIDIDQENQSKFFQQLELLVNNSGLPWDGIEQKSKEKNGKKSKIIFISEKDANNLIQTCNDVLRFNVSGDQKKKVREFINGINDYIKFLKKIQK